MKYVASQFAANQDEGWEGGSPHTPHTISQLPSHFYCFSRASNSRYYLNIGLGVELLNFGNHRLLSIFLHSSENPLPSLRSTECLPVGGVLLQVWLAIKWKFSRWTFLSLKIHVDVRVWHGSSGTFCKRMSWPCFMKMLIFKREGLF